MKNISGVARIWCEGHETRCRLRSVGGLETESPRPLAHLWEANPAMAPKLSPQFFERNLNRQRGHFAKIHSISKFNLPFLKRKLDVRFICVEIGIYLKNVPYTSKFNTKIYKNSSTSDSVLRPVSGLHLCTAPTGDFRTPNPTTLPQILGLRSAHDQSADGVETKENGNGASHSPVDQRI